MSSGKELRLILNFQGFFLVVNLICKLASIFSRSRYHRGERMVMSAEPWEVQGKASEENDHVTLCSRLGLRIQKGGREHWKHRVKDAELKETPGNI